MQQRRHSQLINLLNTVRTEEFQPDDINIVIHDGSTTVYGGK